MLLYETEMHDSYWIFAPFVKLWEAAEIKNPSGENKFAGGLLFVPSTPLPSGLRASVNGTVYSSDKQHETSSAVHKCGPSL